MKNLKQYLLKAKKEGWALGQFNFSDFTQLKAVANMAKITNSPVILGTSEGESKFFGLGEAVALRNFLRKQGIAIFLNLDHGKTVEYVKMAVDAGYDIVHFDGSAMAFEENIKLTRKVVAYARKKKVLVEGEVGKIGTDASKIYTEKFEIKEENLTHPEQAALFAKKTGVDLLAVSIGNFHGIDATGSNPELRLDLLGKIQNATGGLPIVMHGGSGAASNDIKDAIKLGVAKININTELRVAFSQALKKVLTDTNEIVPYKYLPEAQKAVEAVVNSKIGIFGCTSKA